MLCAEKIIFSSYFQDLCGQRNQNIFRKLMLLVTFSIVSAFKDIFFSPNVLKYFFFSIRMIMRRILVISGYIRYIRQMS